MNNYSEPTPKEKIDILANKILDTPRPGEEPPAPTKEELKQKFRIRFSAEGNPFFEEVDED